MVTLNFTHKQLEQITADLFQNPPLTFEIYLDHSQIRTIEDRAFGGFTDLIYLGLSGNYVAKIGRFTFSNLSDLEHLDLSNNSLEDIENGALDTLPRLKTFNVNGNKLKFFSDLLFIGTPAVYAVYANNNQLQNINNAFDPLLHLNETYLDYNPIGDVDIKKLAIYPNLKRLSLRGFNFDLMNVSADESNRTKSGIVKLDLSEAKTNSGIIFEKLKIFPQLETVYLKNCTFAKIDFDAIKSGGLTKVSLIYIEGSSIDRKWLEMTTENLSMQLRDDDDNDENGWRVIIKHVEQKTNGN